MAVKNSRSNKLIIDSKVPRSRVKYLFITILIVIFGISTWLVYRWQHNKVVSISTSLAEANKKADESKKALADEITENSEAYSNLQKKYQEALDKQNTAPIKSIPTHVATQEDLDLTVLKAVTVNWDNTGTTFGGVAINLNLKNTTDSPVSVIPWNNDFKLRDSSNHIYGMMFSLGSGLGKEFVALQDNKLAPGESVTGYIGIQVPDTNILDYTLVIGSHSYKVSATKLTDFPVID